MPQSIPPSITHSQDPNLSSGNPSIPYPQHQPPSRQICLPSTLLKPPQDQLSKYYELSSLQINPSPSEKKAETGSRVPVEFLQCDPAPSSSATNPVGKEHAAIKSASMSGAEFSNEGKLARGTKSQIDQISAPPENKEEKIVENERA